MSFQRPQIVRPPSEWKSYFLPLTGGCSNNTCAFCANYGSKLQIRDVEEVKSEIDALDLYMKHEIRLAEIHPMVYEIAPHLDSKRVFLQDSDALVYPYQKLLEILQYLNQKFPDLERISSYATPQDLLRRSVEELKVLREHKLTMLYVGVESGDDDVLKKVRKRVTHNEIVAATNKAKQAGITLSVTVILGLGGIEGSRRHALETSRILSEIDSEYAGALTLTLVPGTPLYEEAQEGTFGLISPFQSLEELRLMIQHASFTRCFFSSMHASNYYSVRGLLPKDREIMIAQLDDLLNKKDSSLLRPEFMRGL
ncbi:MAG: radical SAM protein [Pseudomonadota bacterium]